MTINPQTLLDRDLSILSFNARVLSLAQRADYPLLERLKFLCIVASNLDEFFEVRMEAQLHAKRRNIKKGLVTAASFEAVAAKAHALVDLQYDIFNHSLMPALKLAGVDVVDNANRNDHQKKWLNQYFEDNVKPLLLPIALDTAHPFPLVASKALHFIIELAPVIAGGKPTVSILRVPRILPRVFKLPNNGSQNQDFVTLTSIIAALLPSLFVNRNLLSYSQFRVTRHSDLSLDEDDISDLPSALRQELAQRPFGEAMRLEVSAACSAHLAAFLLAEFNLPAASLYEVPGPVNLSRLIQLTSMAHSSVDAKNNVIESPIKSHKAIASLSFEPYQAVWPKMQQAQPSIFEQLKQQDVLIHRPFENFDAVIAFLHEAVYDPDVLAIRQTIYRSGSDVRMLNLLQEAVRRGKEVLVVVEIKARFDEEANINWAESLEAIGAQIVYGMLGLKTHAKMLLIMRKEGKRIVRYGHLSTGNYNANTAKLYTDICMLTKDSTLTREMEYVFRHLTSQLPLPRMRKLLVAPFNLQAAMLRQIAAAKRACILGGSAQIIAKMNSLTDEVLVKALMSAAEAGVEIDLIIRGACILPVDAVMLHNRIRVRSIVGRFLEHSRVFYFAYNANGVNTKKMWLSSADWMSRNMNRRIEIAWPVENLHSQQLIMQNCLIPYLADNEDAWLQGENGSYQQLKPTNTPAISAQKILIKRYQGQQNGG
ncbi:MAG: polyphosphate kinase 1 [Bdellovibrio sp.]|nr:polyphosphate kinase 1 [Methylotenera sp.]